MKRQRGLRPMGDHLDRIGQMLGLGRELAISASATTCTVPCHAGLLTIHQAECRQ